MNKDLYPVNLFILNILIQTILTRLSTW